MAPMTDHATGLRRSTRRSLWWAASAVNGRWPRRHNRYFSVVSFFWAWITTELAGPLAGAEPVRWDPQPSCGARRRDAQGKAALVARAVGGGRAAPASWSTGCAPTRSSPLRWRRASMPSDLESRPRSVRLGAWIPLLYGGRKRRKRHAQHRLHARRARRIASSSTSTSRSTRWSPASCARPSCRSTAAAGSSATSASRASRCCNHLAANGWVGFNVNYRLAPRAKAPEHLIDCKLAIAWIREHADGVRRRPRLHLRHRRLGRRPPHRAGGADRQRSRVPARLRGRRHDACRPPCRSTASTTWPTSTADGRRASARSSSSRIVIGAKFDDGRRAVRAVLADLPGPTPTRRR